MIKWNENKMFDEIFYYLLNELKKAIKKRKYFMLKDRDVLETEQRLSSLLNYIFYESDYDDETKKAAIRYSIDAIEQINSPKEILARKQHALAVLNKRLRVLETRNRRGGISRRRSNRRSKRRNKDSTLL